MRKSQILIFILSIVIMALITSAIFKSETYYKDNQLDTIEESIRKALVTCYVSEGFYPGSLDYLKQNYGLVISDKVNIFYQAVGSNIFPDFMASYKEKQ